MSMRPAQPILPRARVALPILILIALMPANALAQSGFLFRPPIASFGIRVGYDVPRADSFIYEDVTDFLTLERSDFNAPAIAADVSFRASERLDVAVGISYARSTARSEFRDWVDLEDQPIEQETRLTRVPLTLGLRFFPLPRGRQIGQFAWIPSDVAPYVGAGVGLMWHRFQQEGDFVDFETLDIFPSLITSDGWSNTAHVFGGAEVSLSSRFGLTVDARYTWSKAPMIGIFDDYDDIDLSGLQSSIGFLVRL